MYMIPDWGRFRTAKYVAYGFDISGELVAIQLVLTALFVLGLTVVAYFFLKTREIAA